MSDQEKQPDLGQRQFLKKLAATATVQVPFACSESQHTYRITTTGGTGPAATQQRVIRRT